MRARTNANGQPADALLEPDAAGNLATWTPGNASSNFVDPTGEQIVGVASGLDESATRTTAPETTAPATVDDLQAYDRPEDIEDDDTTTGIETADLEVLTPGSEYIRLGDLLAEPEQFAGTSLESIERSLTPEAEKQRVTDGICRPGELSDEIELVGHAKWLNNRVDELAAQRPTTTEIAAARAEAATQARDERLRPLLEYLESHSKLCECLELDRVPDRSTLWRSWHMRFTDDLRKTAQKAARIILIKAQNAGATVPREPEQSLRRREDDADEPDPDDELILDKAGTITEHVSRFVFPAFSLNRGEGCEIHENAYWGLQTYLELRERLAANEGACSVLHESTQDRTPLGHAHREHIRDLSVDQVREMYRQAITRLLSEVAETEQFSRAGIVAIDITEADPFTGNRTGHEDEIIGTKEKTDEYAYQWATVQLVGNAVPIVLDARPVQKGETRLENVEDLLDSAEDLVHVDNVLIDRKFDSQHVLEMIGQRGLSYVVPKRMQTSERAQAKRLLRRDQDRYETDRKLHLGKNEGTRRR
jgi:hypothetical protein